MSSDEENERLLGQSRYQILPPYCLLLQQTDEVRRKQDDAAVRILKPHHQRQDHGMSRLVFKGNTYDSLCIAEGP